MNEVEIIASRFHMGLSALHAVGCLYNIRKRNYFAASIHAAYIVWDCWGAIQHAADADGRYQTIREWREPTHGA